MVALSAYVLLALLVEKAFTLSRHTSDILGIIDTVICAAFLADFFVQLGTARNKLHYLRWGWIDLISSIPALPVALGTNGANCPGTPRSARSSRY